MEHKRICRLVSVLFLLFMSQIASLRVDAFTGTFGINYGRLADNIPSADKVVQLLRQSKIRNVRIFDFDHSVLLAFSNTGLELVVGIPNGLIGDMSSSSHHALNWVKDNIQIYYPQTRIVGIAVGNEVFGNDQGLWGSLLGAVKNIYNATKSLQLDKIQITTSHHFGVFDNSYPPSNCTFRANMKQYMKPLLEFFSQIGSPFCLNAYPFLTYMSDPTHINVSYALFQKNPGIVDSQTKLHYDNLLDAEIDAAYAALEDAGYEEMEVMITETGWASDGDQNEAVATPENARTYNFNLRKRLALRKGTPLRPKIMVKAYLFAMFNEDSKPGPTSERNFGLWKPDGSISYDVGFPALKSSSPASLRLQGVTSKTLTVGDDSGWVIPTSPDVYSLWAAKQSFAVNDALDFKFLKGGHTVAVVTVEAAYENCDVDLDPNATIHESAAEVPLAEEGTHYFFCTIGTHCTQGQKFSINVLSQAIATALSPPPTPVGPADVSSALSVSASPVSFIAMILSFVALARVIS